MQRHVSSERRPWLRTGIYTFMTIVVTVVVSLLLLVVLGYQFNEKDGKLEQGGLLQLYSIPTGAKITLNQVVLGSSTNTKRTVDAGSQFVTYEKQGYRNWQKSITVGSGQVAWLSYARLIPRTISPETMRSYTTLSGAMASNNRNYMIVQAKADQPLYTLVDVQNDTPQYKTIVLPAEAYTAPTAGKKQTFTLESWSPDDQSVLIKHTYATNKVEWLLLDRESPEKSINLSSTYVISPTKVVFAGGGHSLLFVQIGGIVQRLNLDEQTLSRPLVTNVAHYSIYDEKTIVYTTRPDSASQVSVGYAAIDIAEPQTIFTYPAGKKPLYATMSRYFDQTYVGVVYDTKMTVYVGTLPTPDRKAEMVEFGSHMLSNDPTEYGTYGIGRFMVATLPNGYATYDLELKKYDETSWKYATSKQSRPLHWLDNYMLWSDNGGVLRFYEFDGANQQDIMPAAEGFATVVTANNKYVYNIAKSETGYVLQRALLLLP